LVARLEDQVRELRAALEDAAEAICRLDADGRVLSVNRAFCRLSGYRPTRSSAAAGRSLSPPPIARSCEPTSRRDRQGRARGARASQGRHAVRHAARGGARCRSTASRPSAATYFFIRDLTERRRMENQLIFAGRMAAVGTLAAGVAHEINNPLAYIVANIDFVRNQITTVSSRLARGGTARDDLAHVLDETGRGADRGAARHRAGAQHRP
jgi:PAS domain S-box-containing protein